MEFPQLLSYLSVKDYLEDIYRFRKIRDPGFSFEVWSSQLGYASRSFLKMVVSQKRRITPDFIDIFSKNMSFTRNEKEYFQLLVGHAQALSNQDKDLYLEKIFEHRGNMRKKIEINDNDDFLLNPLMPLLQVLLSFEDLQRDPENLARLLNAEKSDILDLLLRLEQMNLAQNNNSLWASLQSSYYVPKKPGCKSLRAYHDHSLREAMHAQDLPSHLRRFRSILLPLTEDDYKNLVEDLQAAIAKILAKYDRDTFAQCRLYKVNLNLYPVTEKNVLMDENNNWTSQAPASDEILASALK